MFEIYEQQSNNPKEVAINALINCRRTGLGMYFTYCAISYKFNMCVIIM